MKGVLDVHDRTSKSKRVAFFVLILLSASISGCLEDDSKKHTDSSSETEYESLDENESDSPLNGSELLVNKSELSEHDAYLLFAGNGGTDILLMDKELNIIHYWNTSSRLGNDFQLMPNGDLLGLFKAKGNENREDICFGGCGGSIQILDKNGTIIWQFDDFATDKRMLHHDVELLPNGNILALSWEFLSRSDAKSLGIDTNTDLYYESIFEINWTTNDVVWEWHSIDHMVQDNDPSKPNYGNISESYHRIDFNYYLDCCGSDNGDIMHANGFDYDAERNLIYLSVNFYNEVWVIDHSTNTSQAADSSGGFYDLGGDLVYRFGNPAAHASNGTVLFNKNHHPNLIKDEQINGFGNIIIFSNSGGGENQSIIYELALPTDEYGSTQSAPEVVWSYTNESLYSRIVSGAVRGKGNTTYIAEGDFGIWEVTPDGQVAWQFSYGEEKVWRTYVHYADDPEIVALLKA